MISRGKSVFVMETCTARRIWRLATFFYQEGRGKPPPALGPTKRPERKALLALIRPSSYPAHLHWSRLSHKEGPFPNAQGDRGYSSVSTLPLTPAHRSLPSHLPHPNCDVRHDMYFSNWLGRNRLRCPETRRDLINSRY